MLALPLLGLRSLGRALAFDLLSLGALSFGFLACQLLARTRQLGLLPLSIAPLSGAFTPRR